MESVSASIAPYWMSSIASRSARRSTAASTSCRLTSMPGWSSTTICGLIKAAGASARPRCRLFLTHYHWRRRNSWLLDHCRQNTLPQTANTACQIKSELIHLNSWFLVVRDDGEAPVTAVLALVLPAFRLATHHRHLPVDTEDFGHFGLELRIALLQVVAHLVRPHFLLGQYLADRSLGQLSQARMPGGWSMLPGMCGEQPGRPQLVGITQLLGLPARQRHQPSLCLSRDNGISSRARPIIQCLDHPQFCRSLQAACHCLLRHPNRARHCVGRRLLQIGQYNPRPFDTARGLRPRPRNLHQTLPLLRIGRQRNHSTRCYHWIPQSNPPLLLLPHLA